MLYLSPRVTYRITVSPYLASPGNLPLIPLFPQPYFTSPELLSTNTSPLLLITPSELLVTFHPLLSTAPHLIRAPPPALQPRSTTYLYPPSLPGIGVNPKLLVSSPASKQVMPLADKQAQLYLSLCRCDLPKVSPTILQHCLAPLVTTSLPS